MKATERTPVPEHLRPARPGELTATLPQQGYFARLIVKKDLSKLSKEQQEWLTTVDFSKVPKLRASDVITELEKLDWLPKKEQVAHEQQGRLEDLAWQKPLVDLPPGRYAIENNEGELRFYQRWQGKGDKADRFSLYVMFGPYEAKLPRPAQVAIAKKILDAGFRKCAIRYGNEIGECSNCGRRLTNRISRELAIGPICGGRMFGEDEWKEEVKSKRLEIIDRGEDPDEELEEE